MPFLCLPPLALQGNACLYAETRCTLPPELHSPMTSASGYGALGNWFAEHGQAQCAVQAFQHGVEFQQDSAPLHYSLGMALYAVGRPEKASAEFERTLALDPNFDRAYLTLGVLAHDRGDTEAALKDWETAARLNPTSPVALDWIAKTRIEAGQYTAAADLVRTAPLNEDLAIDLLVADSKASLYEEAISSGQNALSAHGDWQRLRIALATVLVQRNRSEEALSLLSAARQVQPDSLELQVLYLRVLVLMGDTETALPYAIRLLQQHPGNFDALYLAGLLERQDGEYEAALKHLQAAALLQPKHYDVQFNLGATLAKLHRPEQAKVALEHAATMPDASPEVHFQLAGVLRTLGDTTAAETQLKLYQQKLGERARHDQLVSLSAQASRKLAAGDAAGAAEVERSILKAFPEEAVHWYDLSLALDRLGDVAGERKALEQAVHLRPVFAMAWNQLGYLALRAGDEARAEAAFRTAVSSAPQYAEAESNLGSLLAQGGKDAEAEAHFRSALDANPRYTEAWINLAASLASRERFAEARSAAESALKLEPGNAEAAQLLHMLPPNASPEVHP